MARRAGFGGSRLARTPARTGRRTMRLTASQRAKLPPSAFVYPSRRAYPVPTKAQAQRAGISETQRVRMHRSALSRAAQRKTSGTYATVARKVNARSPVTPSRSVSKR